MKKFMKKISALLITAMVLVAMVIPASAATIKIENADDADLKMVQVIVEDPTSETGWKFASDDAQTAFTNALKGEEVSIDAQTAIAMLIKMAAGKNAVTLPTRLAGVEAATQAQLQTALYNMEITGIFSATVKDAGMYAIRATEEGYTYQDMAVYVDFEGVTTPETLTAKKSTTVIEKEITNEEAEDQAVAIGDTIEYTVTSSFPYVNPNTTDKFYKITDTLTGATYDENSFAIKIGNESVDKDKVLNINSEGDSFTVDLSGYITNDNKYANMSVVITYSATVTATDIKNKVAHTGNEVDGSDDVNVYTGTITLTKYGEEETTLLAGAGFNVTKDGSKDALTFVQDVDDDGNVIYGKYTYDPDGTITEVVTAAKGTLEVKGLDLGKYHFAEVTAPDGYSINEAGADAELALGTDDDGNEITVATKIFTDDTDLKDTKLSALPSTGSVGTYLFTIIGVGVMAVMVSLFTIKRRRDARA